MNTLKIKINNKKYIADTENTLRLCYPEVNHLFDSLFILKDEQQIYSIFDASVNELFTGKDAACKKYEVKEPGFYVDMYDKINGTHYIYAAREKELHKMSGAIQLRHSGRLDIFFSYSYSTHEELAEVFIRKTGKYLASSTVEEAYKLIGQHS